MGNFIIKIVDNSTPYIIKVASNNGGGSGTITGAQVVSALGYTPYNASNPLGFITASALSSYATQSYVNGQGFITSSSLVGYATESYVNSQGFLTSISGLNNSLLTNDSNFITASSLSGYATESYVNAQGFLISSSLTPYLTITTAASTYQPIGTYLTSISGLNNSLLVNDSGFITTSALSPYLLSTTASTTYQQILISGTNLKTLNGSSLLGSGDITISGGGSYTAGIGLTLTGSSFSSNISTGKAGGQSVIGGTASGENLTLSSTSNATKGKILFGTSAYDEVNNRLGINNTSPSYALDVTGNTGGSYGARILGGNGGGLIIGGYSNSEGAIWSGNGTPGLNNYIFLTSAGYTLFNGNVGMQFRLNNSLTAITVDNIGRVGILTSPTAKLAIGAGTATAGTGPLKLTAGTNLTTPENGTFEYDGTNLYFTVGGVRKTVTLV